MERRNFIKLNTFALATLFLPINFFKNRAVAIESNLSVEDLIGKSKPELYGNGYQLRKAPYKAFEKLSQAARKEGFKPYAASSYRSFEHQKGIWNRKYNRFIKDGLTPEKAIEKIILYSTIPGTSRHHWGTDLDIIDLSKTTPKNPLEAKHFTGDGVYAPFKRWLDKNAESFGFFEVYTQQKNRKGFAYEPWHLSYRPASCEMLSAYLSLDFHPLMKTLDINGSEHFTDEFLDKYYVENIQDINIELLP